jgi:N-acetylmuramic acid 6-phosphate etherase
VSAVTTEQQNPRTRALDAMSVTELLTAMNDEDRRVPVAVAAAIGQIARAVDLAVAALGAGGRLIYLGAGTSGRLGVLDAASARPPSAPIRDRCGVLAGGRAAMFEAVENAEDSVAFAVADLQAIELRRPTSSWASPPPAARPYVIGGLDHARAIGAATVALAANPNAEISEHADVAIEIDNGPEVLTGSTRLKAGTSRSWC